MSSRTFKGLTGLALTTSLLALNAPAMAQLSDIVVTAQKREQSLQDVPIAITAFDTEALETNRITGLQDIGRVTPGVYVTPNSADQNGVQINIRGIGILDPQIGQDGRVAIYQDGVYIGKTQGLAFDLPDLARLEVLKGPQGTLYGRNTVGGSVNLISARPDPDAGISGKISAEYGNYNHKKINGAINLPMGGSAAARFSGFLLDRDGWVENLGPGTDFAGERKYGFRGAVGWEVGSDFRFDLAADYSKIENESLFYQAFGPGAQPFSAPITPFDNGRQEEVTTFAAPENSDTEIKGTSLVATWTPQEGHEVKTTIAYREADSSRFVALAPTANPAIVNAITNGFNQALAPLPFAFGATGATLRPDWGLAFNGQPPHGPERGLFLSPEGGSPNLVGHNQFSAELTYNGSFADGQLEYTGGLFYFDEETGTGPVIPNLTNANDYLFVLGAFNPLVTPQATRDFLTGFGVPASAQGPIPGSLALLNFLQIPGVGATAFANLQGLNAINGAFLASARQSASNTLFIDSKAFAIYGQATWHATDDLRITGGLRYSDESRDGMGQTFSPFFIDTTDLLGNPILPNISTYEDDKLDPTVILEYDASDDVLLYASYKQSYRAGGFNAAAVGLRLPGETFGPDFNFGREDITAYEAGFKGTFGGNFRLNAAGFYYDFKNKQSTISLNPLISTSRAVVNTNDEIYGFEADAQFAMTDDLTLRGSYTYIDGSAGDLVNPLTGVVTTQDEIQGTPKNSYLVALDYDGDFGGRSVFGNITYSHKDDILRVPNAGTRLGASDLVNAQLGVGFDFGDNEGTLSIWAENLLDEEYEIDKIGFNTFSHEVVVYGQPRSYGVTAGVKF